MLNLSMKRFLKEYFTFSRSESLVMLVLSCLIFMSLLLRYYGIPVRESDIRISQTTEKEVLAFIADLDTLGSGKKKSRTIHTGETRSSKIPIPISFDPNEAGDAELSSIGLRKYVISNILKYRKAGGRFKKPEDLSRIYGMTPEEFNRLKPYINIRSADPVDKTRHTEAPAAESEEENFYVEINSAGPEEFVRIRGIGEVLASRIIRYRDLLGGFARMEQLGEVYGLNDSILLANRDHFRLDTSLIRKISLNNAGFTVLLKHPYLDKNMVKSIVKFREFSKVPVTPADLLKSEVVSDSAFQKILPYLDK